VTDQKGGLIQVKFNLFPKDSNTFTVVNYKMRFEGGKWVVEDIIYSSGKSARQLMKEENIESMKYASETLKSREQTKGKR
jgi:hypothetical protein